MKEYRFMWSNTVDLTYYIPEVEAYEDIGRVAVRASNLDEALGKLRDTVIFNWLTRDNMYCVRNITKRTEGTHDYGVDGVSRLPNIAR